MAAPAALTRLESVLRQAASDLNDLGRDWRLPIVNHFREKEVGAARER